MNYKFVGVHNGTNETKDKNVNVVQQPRIFDMSFTAITVYLLTSPPNCGVLDAYGFPETWKAEIWKARYIIWY